MPKLPKHPDVDALRNKVRELERRLRALEGQTRAESTHVGQGGITVNGGRVRLTGTGGQTVDGGGDIVIKDGGDVIVEDAGAIIMDRGTQYWNEHHDRTWAFIGYIANYLGLDGQPQPGLVFRREDGTLAMALFDVDPHDDNGYHQQLYIYDRKGHPVFLDDWTGEGIAFPQLAMMPQDLRALTDTPRAVDTVWTSIGAFTAKRMCPDVYAFGFVTPAGNPSGNYRYRVTNEFTQQGQDILGTTALPAGTAVRVDRQMQIPESIVPWGELMTVSLDVQLTAGAVGEYWTGKLQAVTMLGR